MRNAASNWLVTCEVKFKVSKMDIIKIICATIRDGEACAYLTDDHGVRSHPGRDEGARSPRRSCPATRSSLGFGRPTFLRVAARDWLN
jgi:hypothetical protein